MKFDMNQFKLLALIGKALGFAPAPKQIGGGVLRAQERLAAKRKANEERYAHLPPRPPSRQVVRQRARIMEKQSLSMRKAHAMKTKVKGGAAAVV